MPDSKTHALIGAAAAAGAWYLYCRGTGREVKAGECILAAGVGAAAGLLPDLIEPAYHPNHRGIFHSVTAAVTLGYGATRAWNNPAFSQNDRMGVVLGYVAYLSHLLADSQTPKSIPLLY